MQIGSSLMSGRTDQPGLRGFFDVVGQTGQRTAPLLFEMGVEKAKADREIGAAALDLYFEQMEDMQDRSGPYVMVYQNYKTENDGSLSLDAGGRPIKLEKPLKVLTVKRTSPEESKFYGFNQAYGFDVFSFVEAGEGQDAFGLNYADAINVKGDAASDAQVGYAQYVKRGLIPLANEIIPLIIERPDLIGASGEIGKIVGPVAQVFEEFTGNVIAGEFDIPYVMVYQNYKTENDGSLSLDAGGRPIKLEKPLKVLTVKRTSPEESKFYGFNQAYGFDVFSFVEAGEGQDAFGLNYADQINVKGDASSDAQVQYATYVKRGLIPLANEIIPLIIERPDLIGASGEIGKIVGPVAQVFEEFTGQVIAGEFDSADPTGSGFAVRETSNGTMNIGGVAVPVFIDRENKYGGNGLTQDRYGVALGGDDYGVDVNGQPARAYVVADTFTKLLQSGGWRS